MCYATLLLPLVPFDRHIMQMEGCKRLLGPTPWQLNVAWWQPTIRPIHVLREAFISCDNLLHWGVSRAVGGGGCRIPPTWLDNVVPPSFDAVADGHRVVVLRQRQYHLQRPLEAPLLQVYSEEGHTLGVDM